MKDAPIVELIKACRKLKKATEQREARTKHFQELAARARNEGRNLSHLINAPTVFDIGNICNEILNALEKVEKANEISQN